MPQLVYYICRYINFIFRLPCYTLSNLNHGHFLSFLLSFLHSPIFHHRMHFLQQFLSQLTYLLNFAVSFVLLHPRYKSNLKWNGKINIEDKKKLYIYSKKSKKIVQYFMLKRKLQTITKYDMP